MENSSRPISRMSRVSSSVSIRHARQAADRLLNGASGLTSVVTAMEEPVTAGDEHRTDEQGVDRDPNHQGKTELLE